MRDFYELLKRVESKKIFFAKIFFAKEVVVLFLALPQKGIILMLPLASRRLIDIAEYTKDPLSFTKFSLIYFLFILLFIIFLSFRYLAEKTYSIELTNKLRHFVLDTLLNTKIQHLHDKDEGYFIQRVNVNSKLVSEFLFSDFNIFITNVILLIGALIMNFKLSPKLTLILLPVFPIFILFSKVLLPKVQETTQK